MTEQTTTTTTKTVKQSHVEMLIGSSSAFAHLLEANGFSINISLQIGIDLSYRILVTLSPPEVNRAAA